MVHLVSSTAGRRRGNARRLKACPWTAPFVDRVRHRTLAVAAMDDALLANRPQE